MSVPTDSGTPPPAGPQRGRLQVFLGYWAGTGRTQAMLTAVERRLSPEVRVTIAGSSPPWIEAGVGIARRLRPCPDLAVGGIDLGWLRRETPDLVLVVDLARQNPPAALHRWRHQDVADLLAAGIDVWATIEVRQVASLAGVVEHVLGVRQPEGVPDALLEHADFEFVDLPPDELKARNRREAAGSSNLPEPAVLVALREIGLRFVADRAAARGRRPHTGKYGAEGGDRLVVCVGPSPSSARVVEAASRMAGSLGAAWNAVHVRTSRPLTPVEDEAVAAHLRLAESLGAVPRVVVGGDVAAELLAFARQVGATRIVLGMTGPVRRSWIGGGRSLVDRVMGGSGNIDVIVIRSAEVDAVAVAVVGGTRSFWPYAVAGMLLVVGTGVAALFDALGLGEAEVVLSYLLAVTATAAWLGRGPAIFASCAAVVSFNYFFTTPRYTLEVRDTGDLFTFAVMLVIGLLVSALTARIREQSIAARHRERRTEQLYELSRDLSATTGHLQLASAAANRLRGLLGGEVDIVLPDGLGRLRPVGKLGGAERPDHAATSLVEWVFANGRIAGAGTEVRGDSAALAVPLATPVGIEGVLLVRSERGELLRQPDRRRLVETVAAQVAPALQRDRLAEQVHRTLADAENERLRSAVLSSVSHDFRTPLAAIAGAASSLLHGGEHLADDDRRDLVRSIYEEAERLARLVDNLLQMTRIEAGRLVPAREWHFVEDLVGSALTRVESRLAGHEVVLEIAEELPLVRVDGVLFELVLTNLLDNAARYSPSPSPIEVAADVDAAHLRLVVADRGPGVSDADKPHVFDKFFRGTTGRADGGVGTGLGLAIAAAIVSLHEGTLHVEDRVGGGARFVVTLPIEPQPPAVSFDDRVEPGGRT